MLEEFTMKTTKRVISAALALLTALSLSAPVFADTGMQDAAVEIGAAQAVAQEADIQADSPTYSGDVLAAVNTRFSTETSYKGYFTSKADDAQSSVPSANGSTDEQTGIIDIYTDPDTGETFRVREPELPELPEPTRNIPANADSSSAAAEPAAYSTGSTRILKSVFDGSKIHNISMKCLYTGTYCTVWGSTSDNSSIRINASQAAQIGQQFDSTIQQERNAFGSYWCDTDGDGKVAIMCYDIDGEYGQSVGTYSAGYFFSRDLINRSGYINSHYFGSNYYLNGLDCIHIDTYPGMGTNLNNISRCYSTLTHEFQHMINFSYCVKGSSYLSSMETYLNEAFSMASEHMILGASSTSSRISYFNSSSYIKGSPLTYWNGTLSNYSNSYLFGQYIRTRYAQTGRDGNTIYKTVLERRSNSNSDTLGIIADLLSTSKKQLILDFWTAVAVRKSSGKYGFNGESWANSIEIPYSSLSSSTSGIYNGGVKFYSLAGKTFTPASSSNIAFVAMDNNGPTEGGPQAKDAQIRRLSSAQAEFSFTPTASGFLRYLITDGESSITHDMLSQGTRVSILGSQQNAIQLYPEGPDDNDSLYLSFDLVSNTGAVSTVYRIKIPPYRYMITYAHCVHGTLQVMNSMTPVQRGDLVIRETSLRINAIPDEGYVLKSLTANGDPIENGCLLTVDRAYYFSAEFVREDPNPAIAFDSGTGTQDDPYVIATPAQWKYFSNRVNGGDSMKGKYITFSDGLDLDGVTIEPVGKSTSTPFAGTFDGRGRILKNIEITSSSLTMAGLFGVVSGTVQDLTIHACTIQASAGSSTSLSVGTIAAYLLEGGTIENCAIFVSTAHMSSAGVGAVGGIVGMSKGTIRSCYTDAYVGSDDQRMNNQKVYVGGIAGISTGTIQNCHKDNTIYVSSSRNDSTLYLGGVCGGNSGSILNCAAPGPWSKGGKAAYSGGISGSNFGTISGCVCYDNDITAAAQNAWMGGIAGWSGEGGTIQNCLAAAKSVQSGTAGTLGYIAGHADTVENCYYASSMTCTGTGVSGTAASAAQLRSADWVSGTLKLDTASFWDAGLHPKITAPTLKLFRMKTGVRITATADQGTVSVTPRAFPGMTVTVEMVEDDLVVDTITVNGTFINGDSFVVQNQSLHTVYATTARACRITVVQPEKGSITVSKTKAKLGDTIRVSTSANIYAQIYVDGKPISGSSFVVTGDHVVTAKIVSVLASGQYGTNAQWKLTEDGVLHILGTGAIETYGAGDLWKNYSDKIKHCVIEEGITSIPDLPYLQSVISLSIPASVTSISWSFDFCYELTAIIVDKQNANYCDVDNVLFTKDKTTLIRYPAKKPGSSYVIPDGVLHIREDAFHSCDLLTDIRIPASVTSISDLFKFCDKLTAITVDEQNASYCDVDGVLFSKDKTALIRYPEKKPGSSYVVPDSVLRIGDDAFFNCDLLAEIRIPASVSEISDAFGFCNALAFFTVDAGNSSYCDFDGVLFNKDQTLLVCYPAGRSSSAYTIPDGVVTVEKYAFHSCEMLEALVIPSTIATIKDSAISGCYHLDDVYYVGTEAQWNAIHIGSYNYNLNDATRHYVSAADACMITVLSSKHGSVSVDPPLAKKGETVTVTAVPDTGYQAAVFLDGKPLTEASFTATGNHTVTAVFTKPYDTELFGACGTSGSSVFWALTDDGTLHIYGTGAMMSFWDAYEVPWWQYRQRITSCEIELGVTSIGNYGFCGCTSLAQIIIPSGVTHIGESAFYKCSALQSVTLPNSITNIGVFAFSDSALSDVYYVGTEAQWNAINIDRPNNPDLTKAALHYLSASVSARASDAGLQIAADSLAPAKLIAVFYDRQTGRMLCLRTYELTAGQTAFTIDTAALGLTSYRAKVMVLNDSNMPLCRAAEVRK